MIKKVLLGLFVLMNHLAFAQENSRGFIITQDSCQIAVSCINERIIHVRIQPEQIIARNSLIVQRQNGMPPKYRIEKEKRAIRLITDRIIASYSYDTKNIVYIDALSGDTILREKERGFSRKLIAGENVWQVKQTFCLQDEALYGLGQYQEGVLNYRGKKANLVQANMEIANPVLISTKPYGILWDNYSKTLFEDNERGASFWSEVADGIDYYFIYGEKMDDVIAGYHDLTGKVPLFPKSAFGFWQSKERYKSFNELVDVVAEYRKRNIPIDNIVQDWEYWGDRDHWNSLRFDTANFNYAKETIQELHDKYHVRLMLSVWPGFGKRTDVYQEMEKKGLLFDEPTWADYKVMDVYSPQAQAIFWKHLKKGLFDKGVDSWWMDATEPSFREGFTQDKQEEKSKSAGNTYIGSFDRYLNVYSLFLSKTMYENLRLQNNKRVSILTRSAFAGQQKYATAVWSGDVSASWEVFKRQIPAGLNLCMTGIPYWTSDIGGFFVTTRGGEYPRGLEDPAYKELYLRWFQQGAFTPIFRAHGSNVPREIWKFGKPGDPFYDGQVEMIKLRYSLLAYIYSSAWEVTNNSRNFMRALAMDFSSDKKILDSADSYMFGASLLVHPITSPMYYDSKGKITNPATLVPVYLPEHKGRYWFDFYSKQVYKGGKVIDYNAPLKTIPVFIKAGSILPINKVKQYVEEKPDNVLDIFICGGEDASFTLYEDDNVSYDYEKGIYSQIRFVWDNKTKELTIHEKEGKMTILNERLFRITLLLPQENRVEPLEIQKEVIYKNEKEVISFSIS